MCKTIYLSICLYPSAYMGGPIPPQSGPVGSRPSPPHCILIYSLNRTSAWDPHNQIPRKRDVWRFVYPNIWVSGYLSIRLWIYSDFAKRVYPDIWTIGLDGKEHMEAPSHLRIFEFSVFSWFPKVFSRSHRVRAALGTPAIHTPSRDIDFSSKYPIFEKSKVL